MPKFEVIYKASQGGEHRETFDAADAKEARKKAARYRASFGSSGKSFRTASIRKVGD